MKSPEDDRFGTKNGSACSRSFFSPKKRNIGHIDKGSVCHAPPRITGKEGQRQQFCSQRDRTDVEIRMPQDVYIYNPIIPVPKYIRHAEIPEGITVIREDAFRRCSRLQSVVIPDSVTEIGAGAFYDCSALRSVTIPDSVTKIGGQAFYNCYGLRSLTISDGVTEIGERTFYGCNLLQSVTIPGGITEIPKAAFWGCSGLQSVTIPDGVTKIGVAAFGECSGLRSVTIPKSVTGIGEYAVKPHTTKVRVLPISAYFSTLPL